MVHGNLTPPEEARRPKGGDLKWTKLAELGDGSLKLKITAHELREHIRTPYAEIDGLEWIEFEGEACVPRSVQSNLAISPTQREPPLTDS